MNASNVQFYEQMADAYPLFFRDYERNMEEEGAWLEAVLAPLGVRTVLDACCGSGRQAIPLARRGFLVTGADPCGRMLEQEKERASAMGVTIPLIQSSFSELRQHVSCTFDAVIALGNGLCNQERLEEIARSLAAMRGCCRGGGVCIIGIKDFDAIRNYCPTFHGHSVIDVDGERRIVFETWDFCDPLLAVTAFVLTAQADQPWTVRAAQTREFMLGRDELRRLALLADFREVERLDHASEAVYLLRA
jgi:SAM-dependent methyltransferase